jgi:hypothetical protein
MSRGSWEPWRKTRPRAEAELPRKILPGSPPGRELKPEETERGKENGRIDGIPGTNHIPAKGADGVGEGQDISSMEESDLKDLSI